MTQEEKILGLLSKLFAEKDLGSNENDIYNQLYEHINREFVFSLNKTDYRAKTQVIAELGDLLKQIELFIKLPQLVGKTVIGIMETASSSYFDIMKNLFPDKGFYLKNRSLPAVIFQSKRESQIKTINQFDNTIILNDEDFLCANSEIYKYGIDIRRFLSVFSIPQNIKWPDITFVNFPLYALKNRQFYKNLLEALDAVVIPIDSKKKWEEDYNAVKHLKIKIEVFLLRDENNPETVGFHNNDNIIVGNLTQLVPWIDSLNIPRNNVSFQPLIHRITNKVCRQLNSDKEKAGIIIEEINKNLLNLDDNETRVVINQMKGKMTTKKTVIEGNLIDYKKEASAILEITKDMENLLLEKLGEMKQTMENHGNHNLMLFNLCLELIEAHEFSDAQFYLNILRNRGYEQTHVLEIYMLAERGLKIPSKYLELLKCDTSTDLVIKRSKVRFWNLLGIPVSDVYSMLLSYEHIKCLTRQETELLGDSYSEKSPAKAISYYESALEMGSKSAGSKLLGFKLYNTDQKLYYLASLLDSEASYLYGKRKMDKDERTDGLKYMKISAALNNRKAIRYLADHYYRLTVASIKNQKPDSGMLQRCAMELYLYLVSDGEKSENIYLNLGQLYYWNKDFIRAMEYLKNCSSKQALHLLGRMYQYGDGVAQDLEKARDLFQSAAFQGDAKSKIEYEKVCGWIQSKKERSTVRNTQNYSSHVSSHYTGSSGGCFITTATCLALGKSEDCEELAAFHKYRDEQLIFEHDGAKLIREYYRIAPHIVRLLDNEPDSLQNYQNLYKDYILDGYKFLLIKDWEKAKQTYIKMVSNLCIKYNIEINM